MIEVENPGVLKQMPVSEDTEELPNSSFLQRIALRVTDIAELWFPDAYVIALFALLVVCLAAISIGASPMAIVAAVGDGYWKLNNFTYQMAMVILTGFAVAACAPVRKAIKALATVPKTGPGAVVFIIGLGVIANLLHWGFGLMFSVFLVMACTARDDLALDVRAAAAAGFVGNTASMMGLSSSAALLHATPSSLPTELLKISGLIPFSETVLLWQNAVSIILLTVTMMFVGWATAPRGSAVKTARDMGIDTGKIFDEARISTSGQRERRPGDYFFDSPLLTIAVGLIMLAWIVMKVVQAGFGAALSNLNNYLFVSLTIALLLHWRVRSFIKAMSDAIPAVGGIIIQYPVYAAVAAVLMLAKNATGHSVSDYLGHFFASFASRELLPPIVGIYSIIVGLFIPSAGAKWVVEAPYILHAGNEARSHLGWLVNTYNGSETLANLLNPFWMLSIIGLMRLSVRNVVGFTFMYFVFLAPVMIISYWLLGYTLDYHPPVMP